MVDPKHEKYNKSEKGRARNSRADKKRIESGQGAERQARKNRRLAEERDALLLKELKHGTHVER